MGDFKQQLAPGWSAVNIGITVVFFLLGIWPVSVLMIGYIVWGQRLGLDLSRPHTVGAFGKKLAAAWKAGMDSFSKN